MKQPADYTIDVNGKKIPLLFNTWMFRKFCLLIGIEYEDLLSKVTEGQAFKFKDVPKLLLIANESYNRSSGIEASYTEDDACDWVDAIGGFNSDETGTIYKTYVSKLLNIPLEKLEVLWNKAQEQVGKVEKKKGSTKAV